jgi:hypothetical protein
MPRDRHFEPIQLYGKARTHALLKFSYSNDQKPSTGLLKLLEVEMQVCFPARGGWLREMSPSEETLHARKSSQIT